MLIKNISFAAFRNSLAVLFFYRLLAFGVRVCYNIGKGKFMKNIIFLSVSLAVYCVCLIVLGLKLRDILSNPEKYGNPELVRAGDELEDSKRHFPLFKSLSHQYSMAGALFTFILSGIDVLFLFGIQHFLVGGDAAIFIGSSLAGIVALFFLNIIVGMGVIPLAIKRPFFEVATRELFNCFGRVAAYKRTYLITLLLFALTFPFGVLGANNYCYYNDEEIGYSGYFQLTEQVFRYEDIDGVNVYIKYNKHGAVDTFYYEIFCENEKININRPGMGTKCFTEQTYDVHQFIEQKGDCPIDVTPPSEEAQRYIAEELSVQEREIAEYIFSGFHR